MVINIGALLGGIAGAGSQILDERREQKRRDDEYDKRTTKEQQLQIALEGRQNAEYRKRQRELNRKETDKFTAQLASFDFTPENITAIAAGGAENVKTWVDIALQHKKSGKDFDINLLVNNKVATDVGTITEATNDVADANKITQTSNPLFASIYEVAPEFEDLNKAFDFYTIKANNTTGKVSEDYQKQADNALKGLLVKKEKLDNVGTSTQGDIFSKPNITTLMKQDQAKGADFVNMETDRQTQTIIRSQGDLGRFSIGVLKGVQLSRSFNQAGENIASERFAALLTETEKLAKQNLRLHADKAIGGQENFVTQFIKTEDLMANFGTDFVVPPKQTEAFNKGFVPESILDIANANGAFTYGSVVKTVDANGVMRVVVYTGFENNNFFTAHMQNPEEN